MSASIFYGPNDKTVYLNTVKGFNGSSNGGTAIIQKALGTAIQFNDGNVPATIGGWHSGTNADLLSFMYNTEFDGSDIVRSDNAASGYGIYMGYNAAGIRNVTGSDVASTTFTDKLAVTNTACTLGAGMSYSPFTGSHVGVYQGSPVPLGTVMAIQAIVNPNNDISGGSYVFKVAANGDIPVGVLASEPDQDGKCHVNCRGDGMVLCNGTNGNLTAGHWLEVDALGICKRSNQNSMTSTVVFKAMESVNFVNGTDVKLVNVSYFC